MSEVSSNASDTVTLQRSRTLYITSLPNKELKNLFSSHWIVMKVVLFLRLLIFLFMVIPIIPIQLLKI